MAKRKYISVDDFADKHDVSTACVYVQKHIGHLPPEAYIKSAEGWKKVMIDENWVLRRVDFKNKIAQDNIELLYTITKFITQYKLPGTAHSNDSMLHCDIKN